jgi:polyketide biosynthesis enoyl-CoA hydratase PksI
MTDPGARVRYLCRDDGVATIELCDAAERNALSESFVAELERALGELAADERARVCVLRGLPEVFCAGGHQDMLVSLSEGAVTPADLVLTRAVLEIPVPTVAAMEGHAVGGGLVLGVACDLVLAARESRYGASFMNMGFTPGMGATALLARALGEHRAAEMMYSGRFFRGNELVHSGMNYVLPRPEVLPKAMDVAQRIAEKPRHALALLKRTLSLGKRLDFERARTVESLMHEICFARPETKELIAANYVGGTK